MKRPISALATMGLMLTFLGDDCLGSVVEDPSFRLWKSDTELAAWDVTAGSIRKAPTWDDADPGVELVETPTEISQQLAGSSDCIQVTVMGLVEDSAKLTITTAETVAVPTLPWDTFTAYLSLPARYDADAGTNLGTTLKVRKSGSGRVILSKIDAKRAAGCGPSTFGKAPKPPS